MRENVNPWDYRYARSIPTKRKVFEFGYVYNICNLLMVLKPLIYSRNRHIAEKNWIELGVALCEVKILNRDRCYLFSGKESLPIQGSIEIKPF